MKTEDPHPGSFQLVARVILACVIPLLATGSTWAQGEDERPSGAPDNHVPRYINGELVYRVGPGISIPRPVYIPDPEYSEEARMAKYQGTCVLWLIIGSDGKPHDVRIARSLGMGLDEKSIEAVRKWRFEPARKDGQPVAVQMNVETSFRLSASGVPATLEPPATNGTQPSQPSGTSAADYPLMVGIRFVTGQQVKKGYVVNAEATIHEGGRQLKTTISCGPKGNCLLLRRDKYPARWLGVTEIELLGREDSNGKWRHVKFAVAPLQSAAN